MVPRDDVLTSQKGVVWKCECKQMPKGWNVPHHLPSSWHHAQIPPLDDTDDAAGAPGVQVHLHAPGYHRELVRPDCDQLTVLLIYAAWAYCGES